jgi:PAS domain S-box-containing protein
MDRENQAVQSNDQLRRIIDSVPTVITVLDSDGKFIYANRVTREYTGLNLDQYRSVDVIGRLIHPDDAEKVRAARKHAFSEGARYEQEARLLGKMASIGGSCFVAIHR